MSTGGKRTRHILVCKRHLIAACPHPRLQRRDLLSALADDVTGVCHVQRHRWCNHSWLIPAALGVQCRGQFLLIADAPRLFTVTQLKTGAYNRLLSDGTYNYEYDAEGNRTKRTDIATGAVTEYNVRFTAVVPVPNDGKGAELVFSGKIKSVDPESKSVTIALTATTGGKKIFGRAIASAKLA